MVWGAFLNNKTVKQASLLPNGQYETVPRYVFIESRDLNHLIILMDEKSQVKYSWAVGVNNGKNPPFQVGSMTKHRYR